MRRGSAGDAASTRMVREKPQKKRKVEAKGTSVFNESTIWFGKTPIVLRTDTAVLFSVSQGMSKQQKNRAKDCCNDATESFEVYKATRRRPNLSGRFLGADIFRCMPRTSN